MTDITQAQLDEVVAYYVNANDKQTARNYIETWGPKIPGYNVVAGLQQLTNEKPTPSVNSEPIAATPTVESKAVEESTPAQATTASAGVTTPSNTDENTNKEE